MTKKVEDRTSILHGIRVLDGGLASELERRGANINGPLWSAHVLEDEPERVAAVHRAYIEAGTECIATCSYQVSRKGYAEFGLLPDRADAALLRAVAVARSVTAEFSSRRVLVAGSLGPFGAVMHNGAEYHGNYDCSHAELVRFHRERIAVLAEASEAHAPDLLAFETFPSFDEAKAVCEALEHWPDLQAWLSFTCRDEKTVAHGEPVRECAVFLDGIPQIVGIGINCVPSRLVQPLIAELRSGTRKPILIYPNSGEGWDAEARCWIGSSEPADFGANAAKWFDAGAQIVGGCCRTGPEHIRQVVQAAVARY